MTQVHDTEKPKSQRTGEAPDADPDADGPASKRSAVNLPLSFDIFAFLAAAAAVGSAIFAGYQYRLTRDAMVAQQRAWVTVRGATLNPMPTSGQHVAVVVEFENTGQSPGVVTNGRAYLELGTELHDLAPVANGDSSRVVMGRDSRTTSYVRSRQVITGDDLKRILENQTLIFVVGDIAYRDIFGQDRHTSYCFRSRGDGQQLNVNLEYCPEHNDAR